MIETKTMPAREVKISVRKRDRYRCVECGMTAQEHLEQFDRNLEVHRVVPGSVYTVDGCITLCRICHNGKPKSPRGSKLGWRMVRIRRIFLPFVEQAIEENSQTLTEWVNQAVREQLERDGLWPPKDA